MFVNGSPPRSSVMLPAIAPVLELALTVPATLNQFLLVRTMLLTVSVPALLFTETGSKSPALVLPPPVSV